jgi:hypothetical protein
VNTWQNADCALLLLLLLQNLPVTIAESNAGLVPPAVAQELMGAGESRNPRFYV